MHEQRAAIKPNPRTEKPWNGICHDIVFILSCLTSTLREQGDNISLGINQQQHQQHQQHQHQQQQQK